MEIFKGIAASSGIAIGRIHIFLHKDINKIDKKSIDVKQELKRFENSLKRSRLQIKRLNKKYNKKVSKKESSIINVQEDFLNDEVFIEAVKERIANNESAVNAIKSVLKEYENILLSNNNELFKERTIDMKDIGYRLISNIIGIKNDLELIKENIILVANELTPSDTIQLDKNKVMGIVTDSGGLTSHTAILARSLGIPAVVGLKNLSGIAFNNEEIIVDGNEGYVILMPDDKTKAEYTEKYKSYKKHKVMIQSLKDKKAVTQDGIEVRIDANIGSEDEVLKAIEYGAEGIGLFRSEFLYINRFELPSEQEQFEAYKYVVEMMKDKHVIIRTFDIGGDKDFPYLGLKKEDNPYLGMRGLRFSLSHVDIFTTQLRAILRASAFGNVGILLPMVTDVSEVIKSRFVIEEIKKELISEHVDYDNKVKIGIMIEVPSAALSIERFMDDVDFFSIGTNDLTQYVLAVDRSNEIVADYYIPLHSSVLKLIEFVNKVALAYGKDVTLCGELAAFKEGIPALIKAGIRGFSMSPTNIPEVKQYIRELKMEDCDEKN